ncbi:MAG: hypothetical protein QOF53_18 [Nocardioidaceae bacterium]|nr:hypothetical protein [Nocardioidaceae bacterium]
MYGDYLQHAQGEDGPGGQRQSSATTAITLVCAGLLKLGSMFQAARVAM